MQLDNKAFPQARRLCAILLAALSLPALAADHWLAVDGSDCMVWSDERLKLGEVIQWSGGCEDGRLAGQGVLEVTVSGQRQVRFEGVMRGGKADGEGVLESREQEGEDRYRGGFADSLFDGFGALELANGSRYEGGFKADKPDGYGLYQGTDGSLYQGELAGGVPQGKGFEVTADGAKYEGEFADGARHGEGTLLFADGGIYEGGFADGKANGKGVYTDPFDDVFEGTWSDGKADGEFLVTRADGTTKKQLWRNDHQVAGGGGGEQ